MSLKSIHLPSYRISCSQSEAVEFIQESIEKLKEAQESSNFHITNILFSKLSQCYYDLKKYRIPMVVELLKQNYVSISSSCINKYNELGYFKTDDIWNSTYYCLSFLVNYSDSCPEIGIEILKTDLTKLLVDNMLHGPYIDNLQIPSIYQLINLSLLIIYNICRFPGNECVFKSDEMKKLLVDLVKTNGNEDFATIAMILLALLVNEDELDLLAEARDIIKIIIKYIKTAIESNTKRIQGFKIWELVNGLKYISSNDTMKKAIVRENGIKLMFDIVNNSKSENDIEMSLGVLWNLCFDNNIKTILINDFDIKNVIKVFENHKSSKIKKCCRGILWLIEGNDKKRIKYSNKTKDERLNIKMKFDVFLSYSWANKSIVLPICKELEKYKIKVWIDVNQMKGSTLESMADGIENSKIFVLAISDSYRKSPSCREEAEYAHKLKKTIIPIIVESKYKPTGWLGMIMGCKTYYEFSERRVFDESFRGLLSNIQEFTRNEEEPIKSSNSKMEQSDFVDSGHIISKNTDNKTNISKWSNEDVEEWLIKSGLGDFKSDFSLVDGRLLISMIGMNCKAPDYLYKTLKNEHGLKLLDMLKLNLAITDLNL